MFCDCRFICTENKGNPEKLGNVPLVLTVLARASILFPSLRKHATYARKCSWTQKCDSTFFTCAPVNIWQAMCELSSGYVQKRTEILMKSVR